MLNDCPLDDPKTQEALQVIVEVMRYYDLAGGVYLVNAQEMGFAYHWETTWNAMVTDPNPPEIPGARTLGFRIRVKEADLGAERAAELMQGTGWCIGAMKNFGLQCVQWADDLFRMLRKSGVRIEHRPPSAREIGHIAGFDQRQR